MTYAAPIRDMLFNIEHLGHFRQVTGLPAFNGIALDIAEAVLTECARFAERVVAPLNASGDRSGSTYENGRVTMPAGFREAYLSFVEGGWQGVHHPGDYGGQGLPRLIGAACGEMFNSANMSFALCPLLTDGAIDALLLVASPEIKALFLDKLVSGVWTGTMNLTEPQAGSDLGLLRTAAERRDDGTYRVSGSKIFITYGDHDQSDNIVHLVLARTQGGPPGVKGLSLFLVPKYLVNADGSLGDLNDVRCTGIEHKLGIKASPTTSLQFGENEGALGYLIGEENRGLEYMFVMMNSARFAVGVQGVAIAERAYQKAVAYARDRVQSRPVDGSNKESVAIIRHPETRRLLMRMRALTEGCRALAVLTASFHDLAHHEDDADARARYMAYYEFLVPVFKGYSTETSLDVASHGVQIHGGMGFIEETGAAQHFRDCRILTIYEGTTAIQANDLIGRKLLRDNGFIALRLADDIAATEGLLRQRGSQSALPVANQLQKARDAFVQSIKFILESANGDPETVYAGGVPFLMLAGNLMVGWQMARSLIAAEEQMGLGRDDGFLAAKIATSCFYAEHILNDAAALRERIVEGGRSVLAMPEAAF